MPRYYGRAQNVRRQAVDDSQPGYSGGSCLANPPPIRSPSGPTSRPTRRSPAATRPSPTSSGPRPAARRWRSARGRCWRPTGARPPSRPQPAGCPMTRTSFGSGGPATRPPARPPARGPLAAWAEADVLHVLWQGQADQVQLVAGIQPRLWPVQGAEDLWEARCASAGWRKRSSRSLCCPPAPASRRPAGRPIRWCGAGRGRPRPCPPPRRSPARSRSTPLQAARCAPPAA